MTPRSAYDDYVIHSMQMAAYGATNNYPETATAIESIIDSTYLPAANKPQLLRTLMSIYYSQKDYGKAVDLRRACARRRRHQSGHAADDCAGLLPGWQVQGSAD